MTIVEVLIAITILAGTLLSLASFIGRFTRATADAQLRTVAEQLATERLERARWSGTYAGVDSFARVESAGSIQGYPGFARRTWVRRTGGATGDTLDFKTVTVSVTNPAMPTPVKKTTIIAVF
jgi:Tfp pilus assembly protein PilV